MARKWWQRKWYFVLPVVVVGGAGVYFAIVGDWKIAALYFGLAAFYAVLQRRKWQKVREAERKRVATAGTLADGRRRAEPLER